MLQLLKNQVKVLQWKTYMPWTQPNWKVSVKKMGNLFQIRAKQKTIIETMYLDLHIDGVRGLP